MISLLRGRIFEIANRSIVIDVNGVGYKVSITEDALHGLKTGQELAVWTHLAVRENSQDLYGFTSKKERDFFELLITVSGIGPKTALNILSLVASESLVRAIRDGSTAHLVKVSGIGRKTAEKIVLELKEKMGGYESGDTNGDGEYIAGMSSDADAIEALKALGYDAGEARDAIKKVADKKLTDTGAKVKAALKVLG
ncbi:MAG: Holliday junction branch migration protein RuvA [Candidatus Taylorbacteria bacterium]